MKGLIVGGYQNEICNIRAGVKSAYTCNMALEVFTCLLGTKPPKIWATVPAAEAAAADADVEASNSLRMTHGVELKHVRWIKLVFRHILTSLPCWSTFHPLQYVVSTSFRFVKFTTISEKLLHKKTRAEKQREKR